LRMWFRHQPIEIRHSWDNKSCYIKGQSPEIFGHRFFPRSSNGESEIKFDKNPKSNSKKGLFDEKTEDRKSRETVPLCE
jgi:hypothetical protein